MLSVCIPVYNFDVTKLVNNILQQAEVANIDIEILIGDDSSTNKFNNKSLDDGFRVRYIYNKKNLGRSKNRNQLAEKAKYNYLIFIDCDAKIKSKNFLSFYIASIVKKQRVVCGGTAYTKKSQDKNHTLHWKYGTKVEAKSIEERKKTPNKSFSSFNFLIEKELFLSIKFNENLTKYGHEDTLFGYELKKRNITIIQIDNPLIHTGIEENRVFIEKSLIGIDNLIYIIKNIENSKELISDITLLKFYKSLEKKKILPFLKVFYPLLFPISKYILINITQNITLFNFLKILYFVKKNL